MIKKTKIVCTMGPSTQRDGVLEAIIKAGMDCARFNFSHGVHAEQLEKLNEVKAAAKKTGKPVALLLDTKGPEMRLGKFSDGKVDLKKGSRFTLTASDEPGDASHVGVSHKGLSGEVKAGDILLLSDGLVSLKVDEIKGGDIITTVQNDGTISSNKRVAAPGVALGLPPISEQDEKDIIFGVENDMDYIAASFVQRPSDVEKIRELVSSHGGHMEILAKIENLEGVKNFDKILEVSDGIMVARGDLGVEIPAEDVPLIQKEIIAKCNAAGKIVIVATQMLESMTTNPRPTRAEASDVANAILDGTDAIMLSGETASGEYPVEAVETMERIALRTEKALRYGRANGNGGVNRQNLTEALGHATVKLADYLGAKAIVAPTESGYTAGMISKYRPAAGVIALTADEKVSRRLALRWGVLPVKTKKAWESGSHMTKMAEDAAIKFGEAKSGDLIVIVSGMKRGDGSANAIKVYTVS